MQAIIFDLDNTLFSGEQGTLRDGVVDLLNILRRLGVRMGAVTSGDHRMLVQLNEAGIRSHFDNVICADHMADPKGKAGVESIIKMMQLPAQQTAFVSHSHNDIVASRQAGVAKTIHVMHRAVSATDMTVEADYVIEDIPTVLDVLE